MKTAFRQGPRDGRRAQTLAFFGLIFLSVILLCGIAIDSGLLYLAKARMGRAVDGAALAAVGNFHRSNVATDNRDQVATIMRNFAVANYTDLGYISVSGSTTPGGTASPYTTTAGTTAYTYTYNFNDGTTDANGQYKRFVKVVLTTGTGGSITGATCSARCPAKTYFIGFAGNYFKDLKVSSSAVASRHPRLIMVVIDRSASMLQPGGGAFGLAPGVVTFLNFFDTSSDNIGIVSFSSNARLEMPLTTNFLTAGTNVLYNTYSTNQNNGYAKGNGASNGNGTGNGHSTYTSAYGIPGVDPEEYSTNSNYDANYATQGVRRLKFGGQTAADEGMRLAMETMMTNSSFNDPDVLKYLVLFTDGAWNAARTLVAAPGYTNEIDCPVSNGNGKNKNDTVIISGSTNNPNFITNSVYSNTASVVVPVPTLSPNGTNINGTMVGGLVSATNNFSFEAYDHTNDVWLSRDTNGATIEPLTGSATNLSGAPQTIVSDTYVGTNANNAPVYTTTVNVWLQPGSIAYVYPAHGQGKTGTYVSDYTNPTLTTNIELTPGGYMQLVVPGYIIDGILFDGLDLTFEDDVTQSDSNGNSAQTYPRYRLDNFNTPYMWPDDTNTPNPTASTASYPYYTPVYVRSSNERELMFRNYLNLLTGFTIYRPDDPLEYDSSGNAIYDDLITDNDFPRPLNGLGPWYPGAAMYWPFDYVGVDWDATYCLLEPTYDPEINATGWTQGSASSGLARHASYTINMSQPYANPEWCGEWFYRGTNAALSGTTSASSLLTSKSDWQMGASTACPWVIADFDNSVCTTTESTHNTSLLSGAVVWRPLTFNGTNVYATNGASTTLGNSGMGTTSATTGYVSDGNGHYYYNAMAYSGRPTHYYDFSKSTWVAIKDNHHVDIQMLPLCNWKVQEYAWHARAMGVTIYTVGYGTLVSDSEQLLLAQVANSTNTTAGGGSNISYNSAQPIGGQFYSTNSTGISNNFYQVASAIAAALTQ